MSKASTRTPGRPRRDGEPPARERIWQAVAAIPPGCVATYGTVAALAAVPRGARFVGTVLRDLPAGSRLPWHRVLPATGRPAPHLAARQRELLRAEGVPTEGGRVPMSGPASVRHDFEGGRGGD